MIATLTNGGSIRIKDEMDEEVVATIQLFGKLSELSKTERLELGEKIAEAMEG